ncbi:MAG: T9SS type A sorting domain-containing protein [Bacteroidota bacterium]|nr:T9SS type A sorting domain-containing protein [Bacteroidota bacterium]
MLDVRPSHLAGLFLLLAAALTFPGCITRLIAVSVPSVVTVDEPFTLAVDGVVAGIGGGCAALIVEVPATFEFVNASYVAPSARRRLYHDRTIAARFRPDSGCRVLALADSVPYGPGGEERVRVFVTLRPTATGTFTLKFAGGTLQSDGEERTWITHTPADITDFRKIDVVGFTATLTVAEPERNGTTAIAFTGGRDFLALPDSGIFAFTLREDFAIEFWTCTTARDAVLFSTRTDDILGAFPLEIAVDEYGAPVVRSCDGDTLFQTVSSVFFADGTWHHIAVSYTASARLFELYLDAKFLGSLTVSPRTVGVPHAAPLFGCRPSKRKFYAGTVDEVRFWTAARTQEEIVFYRNTALSGYEQNLAALYGFERTSNGVVPSSAAVEGYDAVAYNKPKLVPSTAPLRVELISFSVLLDGTTVSMNWESFDESKVKAFHLEKRTEEGKYATLAVFPGGETGQNHRSYHAEDTWSEKTIVYYRLKKINTDGSVILSDEVPVGAEQILDFNLGDCQPNPFSQATEIPYTLSEPTTVTLRVYDLVGREVADLISERQKPGSYSVRFEASGLPPGPYFYKLRTAAGAQTKKMYLVR